MLKQKHLRTKVIREFKIKWMDKSIKDAMWEREHTLKTNFQHVHVQKWKDRTQMEG